MLYNFCRAKKICGHRVKLKCISLILSIILVVLCIGFTSCSSEENDHVDDGNRGGYVDSGVSKSIGLELNVDRIEKSGNYTYVYCSIENVSAKYVATRYRYIKVKGQFIDYSGKVVDTNWTYAVDSTWIEPGESKTFKFMVRNTSISRVKLSFVD